MIKVDVQITAHIEIDEKSENKCDCNCTSCSCHGSDDVQVSKCRIIPLFSGLNMAPLSGVSDSVLNENLSEDEFCFGCSQPLVQLKDDFDYTAEFNRFVAECASAVQLASERNCEIDDDSMKPYIDNLWKKHFAAPYEGDVEDIIATVFDDDVTVPYKYVGKLGNDYIAKYPIGE